jgi:hypothetical protein
VPNELNTSVQVTTNWLITTYGRKCAGDEVEVISANIVLTTSIIKYESFVFIFGTPDLGLPGGLPRACGYKNLAQSRQGAKFSSRLGGFARDRPG